MGPTKRFAPSAPDTVLTRNRNDSKDKSDELFLTSLKMLPGDPTPQRSFGLAIRVSFLD
jgi:hypothetical protein